MMLVPMRFLTSSASVGRPSTRAKPSGSLKVRRTMATSRRRTMRSPSALSGRLSRSSAVSNTPGTLMAKRPWPVSEAPAATSRLLRSTAASSSLGAQAEALEPQRIDDDLEQLLALAADLDVEDVGQALDPVLELAGQREQRALRHIARQGDDQHREQREVDLLDQRLVGFRPAARPWRCRPSRARRSAPGRCRRRPRTPASPRHGPRRRGRASP